MIRSLPHPRVRDSLPGAAATLPGVAATVIAASVIAPWALGFSASHAAVAAHIAFAMTFAPIALLIAALPAAAVTTAGGGAWLMASPWLLGYASRGTAAWAIDLAVGLVLVALSRRARQIGGSAVDAASRPPAAEEAPAKDRPPRPSRAAPAIVGGLLDRLARPRP